MSSKVDKKNNKKSIFYVIGQLDIGGAETHLLRILPRLKASGYKIILFPLRDGGQLEKEFVESGVTLCVSKETSSKGFVYKLKRIIGLCSMLYRQKPDIVHYFLPEAYLIGGVCSIFSPVSIKVMSRRSLNLYQKNKPFIKYVEFFMHKWMRLVLGNSKAVVNELYLEGINKNKVKLIYNGVDVPVKHDSETRKKMRESLNVSQNKLIITVVSNLIPYKGHKDLLNALKIISDQLPENWIVFFVGRDDNNYSKELSCMINEFDFVEHIKLVGHTRNTSDYLIASDIGILPSHQEGFSNSLLESMAHGLPMIVTDVGGNAEAISDNVNGFVVPAHHPEKLAEKILILANNVELRNRFSENSYDVVITKFSIENCVSQYDSVYKDLLGMKGNSNVNT